MEIPKLGLGTWLIPNDEADAALRTIKLESVVGGNKVPDKVAKVGFTVTPSPNVDAPIIGEYPLTLECKVVSFEDGMLIGEVINQSADESILTDGKVDLAKLKPIVFDAAGMCYRSLGEVVGQAWGSGKAFTE